MLRTLLIIGAIIMGLLIALAAYSYKSIAPKVEIPDQIEASDLKPFLDKVVADNKLPSIAAAIVDKDGVRLMASSGVRKDGDSIEVTDQDLYHLGSCTKAMTAVLTAMHIDDGLLNWDTKFIEVFPELSSKIDTSYHDIDITSLLTHTAGVIANAPNTSAYSDQEIKERRLRIISDNLKDPVELTQDAYLYSNFGYIMVGAMLEKLTGQSWEELMTQRIFTPLGMTSAGFGVPGSKGETDQPWGHYKPLGFGDWTAIQADNPEALGPAGTVHCNLEDWGKFIAFQLLQDDTTLLSQAQREQLLVVHKEDYASGWIVIDRTWANGKAYNHAGTNTMNFALTWVAPENDRAYLICTNSHSINTAQICDGVTGALLKIDGAI